MVGECTLVRMEAVLAVDFAVDEYALETLLNEVYVVESWYGIHL